jgi:hypothetical protein
MTATGTDWQTLTATKAARLAAEARTTLDQALAAERHRLESWQRESERLRLAVDAMPPAKPSLLTARDAVALELHGKRYADLPLMFAQLDVDAEVCRRIGR